MNMKSFMPLTDLHSQIYSVTFSSISVCTKRLWCYLLQARINYKQHLELSRTHAAKYIEAKKDFASLTRALRNMQIGALWAVMFSQL